MTGKRLFGRFALGATLGVALTIGATQAWNVTAAPGDTDSTFVPVAPCRLFDTRPGEAPLGGKKTPLGAGQEITQQVTGSIGNCKSIPADAVAVTLNVTIVNPTAQSNLRLWPANEARPTSSNLNWIARQAPTPNMVTVKLSPDGKIKAFNFAGTVDVLVDLSGYYTRTSLNEINQRLLALEAGPDRSVVEYSAALDEANLPLASVSEPDLIVSPASEQLSVTINAPRAGKVAVLANATAKRTGLGEPAGGRLVCQITDDTAATSIDAGAEVVGIAAPVGVSQAQPSLGTNRVFEVAAGSHTYDLMCAATDQPITIHYRSMSATFTPNG
jgi:hypothetical protein